MPRVRDAGGTAEFLRPEEGKAQAFNHLDKADIFPDGVAHPDLLRTVPAAVQVCTSGPDVLITSRNPDDLPAFCQRLVAEFQQQS